MKLRLGISPFLNTRPLVQAILNGQIAHPFELVLGTPAKLAKELSQGNLELSLIPVIEYARAEGYRIIPDVAICATGHVKSVLLCFKNSVSHIGKVALDDASCTSAALIRILLSRRFNIHPEYFVSSSPLKDMLSKADAALLIGDQALIHSVGNNHYIDLGAAWQDYTSQPFVFAFFVVRAGVDLGHDLNIFAQAKQWGLTHLDHIAAQESSRLGLPYEVCQDYLARRITYDLDDKHILALKTFYKLACEDGLINREADLTFYR